MRIRPPKNPDSYRLMPLSCKAKEVLEAQIKHLEQIGPRDNFVIEILNDAIQLDANNLHFKLIDSDDILIQFRSANIILLYITHDIS